MQNPRQDKAEDWIKLPYSVAHPLERILCHQARQTEEKTRRWFVVHAGYDGELPLAASMKVTSVGPAGDRALTKTARGKKRSNLMMCNVGVVDRTLKMDDKPYRRLRCLHLMHTDDGPMAVFSELRDVLSERMAAYGSDDEDDAIVWPLSADDDDEDEIPEPPLEIAAGNGFEEIDNYDGASESDSGRF